MQETTLAEVLPYIAPHLGLNIERDRERLLDEVHTLRMLMFSGLGKEVKEAFFVRRHCETIRKFSHDCRGKCNREYYGITLPADMTKAEVFRVDGERVEISPQFSEPIFTRNTCCFNRRNQRQREKIGCNPCCIPGMDLGKGWPLIDDPRQPVNLGFRYHPLSDCEEELGCIGVEYTDLNCEHRREDIQLEVDGITQTSQSVQVLHKRGITLPPNRKGMVEVYDEDIKIAEYHPSVSVPNHRRIVIGLRQPGRIVEIEDALFEPRRACFDTDMVEINDPFWWQNLIMWKNLHFKTKRTAAENRSYTAAFQVLIQQAQQFLDAFESDTFLPIIEPHIPQVDMRRRYRYLRR